MAAAAAAAKRVKYSDTSDKHYATALKTVSKLSDSTYAKWRDQIERVAYAADWHDSILYEEYDLPDADDDDATYKCKVDSKCAYMLCMATTDGSKVEDVLLPCKRGDARVAYGLVKSFFHRKTAGGQQEATKTFYNATMANTHLNVVQWMANVARNAKALREVGGSADERAQLLQLIQGLLSPEFDYIKNWMALEEGLKLPAAHSKLLDFAQTKNLTALTRGGPGSTKHNAFTLDGGKGKGGGRGGKGKGGGRGGGYGNRPPTTKNPTTAGVIDCRQYMRTGKCDYDPCKFNHPPNTMSEPPGGKPTGEVHMHEEVAEKKVQWAPHMEHSVFFSSTAEAGVNQELAALQPHQSFKNQAPPAVTSADAYQQRPQAAFTAVSQGTGVEDHASLFHDDDDADEPTHRRCWRWPALLMTLLATIAASAVTVFLAVKSGFKQSGCAPMFAAVAVLLSTAILMQGAAAAKQQQVQGTIFVMSDAPTQRDTQYEWCSDSGANRFVTNNEHDFVPGTVVLQDSIIAVGGGTVTSHKTGTVRVMSADHNHCVSCTNVLYLPECSKKLMPASTFVRQGCTLSYHDTDQVSLLNPKGILIFSGKEIDGLYYFRASTVTQDQTELPTHSQPPPDELNYNQDNTEEATLGKGADVFFGLKPGIQSASGQDFSKQLYEAHCAYGHLHFDKIRKLFGLKKGDNPMCEACTIAKSRAGALKGQTYTRSTRPGHRVHMDVGFTAGSEYTFQLYVDDYDRLTYVDVLDSKDQVLPAWKALKATIENDQYPGKVAAIRTDSEPLYRTQEWNTHTREEGIEQEYSSRYRHDANGVVERKMQTLGIAFRAQMLQGNAPASDSPDCIRHTCVIMNHSPTKANNGWTPLEKRVGHKLPVNAKLLKGPLFCLVFAHVYEAERGKNAPRGIACVYLGYDPINNTYLVKEWVSGQRYYTADLTFHPAVFPYRDNPHRIIGTLNRYDELAPHLNHGENERIAATLPPRGKSTRVRNERFARSGGIDLRDIPDVASPPDVVHMVHTFGPDPESLAEARTMYDADDWIAAELAERNSFAHHDVFEAVKRSSVGKHRVYKNKAVCTRKINPPDEFNPNGSLDKHKVRMTVAAYTKLAKQGIDYEEKRSSTVRWNTIKAQVAIAVKYDLKITTTDIKTFFLYGILEEGFPMYMEIPDGWAEEGTDGPDWVWKLKKAVYGMPQAGACAQKALKEALESSGDFIASMADDCVFITKDHESGYAVLGTFVDDIFIVGDEAGTKKVIAALKAKFEITVKTDPTIFCGVQIQQVREKKWLKLHQEAYTMELLNKYHATTSKPVDTPMDPGTAKAMMLLPTEGATKESIKAYQEIVGGLMWLIRTRPDLLFTINLLCRFLKNATQKHVDLVLGRPLKYLAATPAYGIVFAPGDGDWYLSGAADSDLAGDLASARSTSGTMTQIGEYGNISCASRLDRKVSTSTGQAETYAFQELCKEIIWDRLLLYEMGYKQVYATPCYTDNDGVLIQSKKAVNHAMAKHFRIAQAFIKMLVRHVEIEVRRVDSEENPTDTFTKPLTKGPFVKHRLTIMGPQDAPIGTRS
jgi:hypothetical protein